MSEKSGHLNSWGVRRSERQEVRVPGQPECLDRTEWAARLIETPGRLERQDSKERGNETVKVAPPPGVSVSVIRA